MAMEMASITCRKQLPSCLCMLLLLLVSVAGTKAESVAGLKALVTARGVNVLKNAVFQEVRQKLSCISTIRSFSTPKIVYHYSISDIVLEPELPTQADPETLADDGPAQIKLRLADITGRVWATHVQHKLNGPSISGPLSAILHGVGVEATIYPLAVVNKCSAEVCKISIDFHGLKHPDEADYHYRSLISTDLRKNLQAELCRLFQTEIAAALEKLGSIPLSISLPGNKVATVDLSLLESPKVEAKKLTIRATGSFDSPSNSQSGDRLSMLPILPPLSSLATSTVNNNFQQLDINLQFSEHYFKTFAEAVSQKEVLKYEIQRILLDPFNSAQYSKRGQGASIFNDIPNLKSSLPSANAVELSFVRRSFVPVINQDNVILDASVILKLTAKTSSSSVSYELAECKVTMQGSVGGLRMTNDRLTAASAILLTEWFVYDPEDQADDQVEVEIVKEDLEKVWKNSGMKRNAENYFVKLASDGFPLPIPTGLALKDSVVLLGAHTIVVAANIEVASAAAADRATFCAGKQRGRYSIPGSTSCTKAHYHCSGSSNAAAEISYCLNDSFYNKCTKSCQDSKYMLGCGPAGGQESREFTNSSAAICRYVGSA